MLTIWKFELPMDDIATIDMPAGATPMSVHMQDNKACLWALVDPDNKFVPHKFRVAGTGHPIDPGDAGELIGVLYITNPAAYPGSGPHQVYHVFYLGPST